MCRTLMSRSRRIWRIWRAINVNILMQINLCVCAPETYANLSIISKISHLWSTILGIFATRALLYTLFSEYYRKLFALLCWLNTTSQPSLGECRQLRLIPFLRDKIRDFRSTKCDCNPEKRFWLFLNNKLTYSNSGKLS